MRVNYLLLAPAFFCISFIAQSQNPPVIEWQKCLGGSLADDVKSIQQTNDGGYIVAGYSWSDDGDIAGHHDSTDKTDYWVVKLNSKGAIEWQKSLGGSDFDLGVTIRQTKDSGYIVAGESYSTDGDLINNHDTGTCWLVKLNSTGDIDWQKRLKINYNIGSLEQTSDGGYIVAGNDGNYLLVKLDGKGNIEWQKSIGGSEDDTPGSIRQTIDGGYIVAGYSSSNDGDVSGNHGNTDCWIVKLNSEGNIVWQKSLGGSQFDGSYDISVVSVQQTRDTGYVVAARSSSNDGDVSGHHGDEFSADFWIVKLDTLGTIEWQKSIGGSSGDGPEAIQQTMDGGYVAAGTTVSNDGDVSGNNGGPADSWILKLDSSGIIQWQKCLGGSGYDEAAAMQQTTDGGFIVAGSSNSVNGDVSGNHGNRDFWIVKLSPQTYNFTGNGNWDEPLNWIGNAVPPSSLPTGTQIIINPPVGGKCILNTPVKIPSGNSLKIATDAMFIVHGNLDIKQ